MTVGKLDYHLFLMKFGLINWDTDEDSRLISDTPRKVQEVND